MVKIIYRSYPITDVLRVSDLYEASDAIVGLTATDLRPDTVESRQYHETFESPATIHCDRHYNNINDNTSGRYLFI